MWLLQIISPEFSMLLSKKLQLLHHLLTLMSFETRVTFFFLCVCVWNTKRDALFTQLFSIQWKWIGTKNSQAPKKSIILKSYDNFVWGRDLNISHSLKSLTVRDHCSLSVHGKEQLWHSALNMSFWFLWKRRSHKCFKRHENEYTVYEMFNKWWNDSTKDTTHGYYSLV